MSASRVRSRHDGRVRRTALVVGAGAWGLPTPSWFAPGPGAVALLPMLDTNVPLAPRLGQLIHFGSVAAPHRYDEVPCLFEGEYAASPGFYAMPTSGTGYKIGLDAPLHDWTADDLDRTPSVERTRATAAAAERLGFITDPFL